MGCEKQMFGTFESESFGRTITDTVNCANRSSPFEITGNSLSKHLDGF